jgi:DNA-binding MarR family transcriptional regulator
MKSAGSPAGARRGGPPDQQERQVGLGAALRQAWVGYQRRLDEELAAAGFADRGFPDGRVLRMCTDPAEMTISQIGRQLGITRQGAGKIVASLGHRGYVTVVASTTNGREKIVKLTPRANDYLGAQRKAARTIENRFRAELGPESLAGLHRLLEALGGAEQPRQNEYLRKMGHAGGLRYLED